MSTEDPRVEGLPKIWIHHKVVLGMGTAANPVHRGHTEILHMATEFLERRGFEVQGVVIACAPDGYCCRKYTESCDLPVLGGDHRVNMANLAGAEANGLEDKESKVWYFPSQSTCGSAQTAAENLVKRMGWKDVSVCVVIGDDRMSRSDSLSAESDSVLSEECKAVTSFSTLRCSCSDFWDTFNSFPQETEAAATVMAVPPLAWLPALPQLSSASSSQVRREILSAVSAPMTEQGQAFQSSPFFRSLNACEENRLESVLRSLTDRGILPQSVGSYILQNWDNIFIRPPA